MSSAAVSLRRYPMIHHERGAWLVEHKVQEGIHELRPARNWWALLKVFPYRSMFAIFNDLASRDLRCGSAASTCSFELCDLKE